VKTHGKKMDKNTTLQGLNPYRALELAVLSSSGLHRRLFKFKPFGLNLTALPVLQLSLKHHSYFGAKYLSPENVYPENVCRKGKSNFYKVPQFFCQSKFFDDVIIFQPG
jgi:hypothetical protein